ncbi:GNAT family N-acetyltransferase [Planococcus shixiaomingii]|uniref:GNAT family N-acetyltransferase n=1 Tax=Planococcus shixiaomingii TaxID=3058393 RepID=UPI0026080290|nr:GNAT family N-acetyltransferase [Planococcus sp. N022]WKA56152.1 GNAT family N-acetyltransferase [Planococcus sp. N022]
MPLHFRSMDELKYNDFIEKLVAEYAGEHIKAGTWDPEEAHGLAQSQIQQLVPEGLGTSGHRFFIALDKSEPVGSVWLNIQPREKKKQAFIFDLKIEEQQQGKGYGKAIMAALDEYAKAENFEKIALHVFAHNERALKLYQTMGYEIKSYNMEKRF